MRVFGFIEAEKANFSIKFMCERLGVTRQGFYAWRKRPPSRRRITDAAYTAVIKKIHADSRGNYGAPRICAELADDYNIRCGRKRVARLMRQAGIAGCHRRKRTWTTRRDDSQPPAPDRVNRQFAAAGPNELWVADITYVPTWAGFGYLATVLDVFSRRIVGWSYATHMRTELIVDAIDMAIETRRPPRGLIHHSDQSAQYTSDAFAAACRRLGVTQSMGRVGCALDNAAAESFFSTLEHELVTRRHHRTRDQARADIAAWIDTWYNTKRLHSTNNMLSPNDYELANAA